MDGKQLGAEAAAAGARRIRRAIADRGEAAIILATGASQFETLAALVTEADVDWSAVTAFHLDEYIGIDADHPASFRRYLRERFEDRVGPLRAFHYVAGDAPDPHEETRRLDTLIAAHTIDVAFIGIGENGHLAFNDPPADFTTEKPYIVVQLDEACRRQQMGEGWFDSVESVPRRAISMSIRQIMKSMMLVASVPDARKAQAVRCAVEGPVLTSCPASMLQRHPDCRIYLDTDSSSLLV